MATKHQLPSAVYKNLDDAIENFNADEVVSESEADERPDNNPKSRRKPKTRAIKSVPVVEADTTSEEESSDDELADSDEVVEASPPRQIRSSVKVKQEGTETRDTLFLRELDSDAEEHFLPPHEAFVLGTSLKRSASPLSFFDNDKGKSKRTRSGSIASHISVNSTDDGTNQDSRSPPLRPATSSFQYQYDPALDPTSVTSSKYSTWIPSWTSTPITGTSSSSNTGNAFASTSSAGSSAAGAAPVSHSDGRSGFSRPTLQRHVPGPPRDGLVVPQPADNPWA
ncbi:hypothetical protein B0H10DRAFT_2078627 [Mycena sp. CBHHK59/15]|nr:hypothetical protein B0H10DRAFT_2078627 [Mycena sp. CBHHK59/15]